MATPGSEPEDLDTWARTLRLVHQSHTNPVLTDSALFSLGPGRAAFLGLSASAGEEPPGKITLEANAMSCIESHWWGVLAG